MTLLDPILVYLILSDLTRKRLILLIDYWRSNHYSVNVILIKVYQQALLCGAPQLSPGQADGIWSRI